jgi:DNA-binding GntR family transcriptional regulator
MSVQKQRDDRRTGLRAFLYRDVAIKLRERIRAGIYPSNAKLPSLNELVEEFNVSAISVRRALRELSYEGLIYGEQGRGVFVKPKSVIHRVIVTNAETSIGDEIERAGFTPTIKELKYDRIKADDEIAIRLQIVPGTKVHRHQKLVLADSEPVSLHNLYFTNEVAKRIKSDLANTFVFRMLQRAGLRVHQTRFESGALALNNDHSPLFKKPAGFPMGILYFTPLTNSGKPIITGTTLFCSDRFVFEFFVPQLQL